MAPANEELPKGVQREYVVSEGIRAERVEFQEAVAVRNTEIITDT